MFFGFDDMALTFLRQIDSPTGTQLILNPSYPRLALSSHFAMYVERPPAKVSISRDLPGMVAPRYQESARGKRVPLAISITCARHASPRGPLPRTAPNCVGVGGPTAERSSRPEALRKSVRWRKRSGGP